MDNHHRRYFEYECFRSVLEEYFTFIERLTISDILRATFSSHNCINISFMRSFEPKRQFSFSLILYLHHTPNNKDELLVLANEVSSLLRDKMVSQAQYNQQEVLKAADNLEKCLYHFS